MGLFSRKKSIDYDQLFKDKYALINQLSNKINSEYDFDIKASMYLTLLEYYDELLDIIPHTNQDLDYFKNRKAFVETEYNKIKDINKD